MSQTYGLAENNKTTNEGLYKENAKIATLFEQFIKEKRYLDGLSERTLASYKNDVFKRWIRFAGGVPTEESLTDFVINMRQSKLSVTTCNITIRSMNSFLSWLTKKEIIPFLRIKKLKEEKRVLRTFTDEQLKSLIQWKPDLKSRNQVRIHAILHFLIDTGVRISEALTLKVDGVDFDNLLCTVTGKGNKERKVAMSRELRKVLYRYYLKHRKTKYDTPHFFCTIEGTPCTYRNIYRDMEVIFKAAGIDKHEIDGFFHAYRRKYARFFVKQGGNLFYLMHAMGHTSLQMTKAYVAVEDEDLATIHVKTSPLARLG
jgi:integrase/recombinase XerD